MSVSLRLCSAGSAVAVLAGCSLMVHWSEEGRPCDGLGQCAQGYFCQSGVCRAESSSTADLCQVEDAGTGGHLLALVSALGDGGLLLETLPRAQPAPTASGPYADGRLLWGNFRPDAGAVFAAIADLGSSLEVRTLRPPYQGPFAAACDVVPYDLSRVGQRVASGDFDGDGDDDIALYCQDPADLAARIHILRFSSGACQYQGDAGWWSTPGPHTLMEGRFVSGDFDGDGKKDLVALYGGGPGATLQLFRSTGSAFTLSNVWSDAVYDEGATSALFLAGDFSGDGKSDVAAFVDLGNSMEIHRWTSGSAGDGGFVRTVAWSGTEVTFAQASTLAVAMDFDQDGKSDIVSLIASSCGCGELLVFRSAEDGGFALEPGRGRFCAAGLSQSSARLLVWP